MHNHCIKNGRQNVQCPFQYWKLSQMNFVNASELPNFLPPIMHRRYTPIYKRNNMNKIISFLTFISIFLLFSCGGQMHAPHTRRAEYSRSRSGSRTRRPIIACATRWAFVVRGATGPIAKPASQLARIRGFFRKKRARQDSNLRPSA